MIYREIEAVPLFKYGMIMADPPWRFKHYSKKGETEKSAAGQYRLMDLEQIQSLRVIDLASADGCWLWLWATHPMLPQAIETLGAWGFEYVTSGVWTKFNHETQKLAFATGYCLRSASEPFILGRVGKPKRASRSVRTVCLERSFRHSQKPDGAFKMAEELAGDVAKLELFSRQERNGWDVMGDEL